MAHAEVQSLGVYKFVLNWLSIMWLRKVRYQPEAAEVRSSQLRSDCCRWKVVNERLQWDPMQTLSVSLDGADAAVHCTRGSSVPSTGEHKKQCTQCSFLCPTNGRTRCAGYGICLDYSGSSQATLMSNRMTSDFTH